MAPEERSRAVNEQEADWDVVRTMERFGGSFVWTLAQLCHLADSDNLARIKAAWPEYWAEYAELAASVRRRDEAHAAATSNS